MTTLPIGSAPDEALSIVADMFGIPVGPRPAPAPAPAYGASTVKRRRRTGAELEAVDAAIVAAVAEEHPVSLRGVF